MNEWTEDSSESERKSDDDDLHDSKLDGVSSSVFRGIRLSARFASSQHGAGGVATAANSVDPAVIGAQSPQAFSLAVPLQVEIMTNVAVS